MLGDIPDLVTELFDASDQIVIVVDEIAFVTSSYERTHQLPIPTTVIEDAQPPTDALVRQHLAEHAVRARGIHCASSLVVTSFPTYVGLDTLQVVVLRREV